MDIRISEVDVKNFVSIGSGKIDVNTSNIVGIFGANGTGKTGTLTVLKVLQRLLDQKDIPGNLVDVDKDTTLTIKFNFSNIEDTFDIIYSVKYNLEGIISESLYSEDFGLLISYDLNGFKGILADNFPDKLKSLVIENVQKLSSYIFNGKILNFLELAELNKRDTILMLNNFARNKMIFIDAEEVYNGSLKVNIGRLVKDKDKYFNLIKELSLDNNSIKLIKDSLIKINPLLKKIINRSLKLEKIRDSLYIICVYNGDKVIPIKDESLGIRRFILYLYSFILLRNDRSICLCVDEIDSGIFEPLLRELVLSVKTVYAGQLWFTAHNFELVSALNSSDIIFTTLDSNQRFMRLDTVKVLQDIYEKIENGFYGKFDEAEIDYLVRGSYV